MIIISLSVRETEIKVLKPMNTIRSLVSKIEMTELQKKKVYIDKQQTTSFPNFRVFSGNIDKKSK